MAINRLDIRTERLNGKIVAMSPRPTINHNRAIGNIHAIFRTFLKGKPCEVFSDGLDVFLDDDILIPDMTVVCDKTKLHKKGIVGAPDLVVEVLSPSTANNDRGYKKDLYEKHGVKEYWIIDTSNKTVEIYTLKDGKYILHKAYDYYPEDEIAEMLEEDKKSIAYEFKSLLFNFTIKLEDVFENIL